MGRLPDAFVESLCAAVGADALSHRPLGDTLDPGWHPQNLGGELVVAPASTAEVSALLALCNAAHVPVVTHGGRTGLAGGAVSADGEVVLSLRRMNRIEAIDAAAGIAAVEAGVTLQALQERVAADGLSVGIDLAARGTASIGGMVSTNAGGIEAFRNGVMRHRVLGLEAVLADGRVMGDLTRVVKANEGYDLKQLFIGAEGTLGVVTRVVLALEPLPGPRVTALLACADAARAVAVFARLRRQAGERLRAAEIMWRDYALTSAAEIGAGGLNALLNGPGGVFLIVDVAGPPGETEARLAEWLEEAVEAGEVLDALLAQSGRERELIWRVREDSWSIDRMFPGGLWFDVSVPLALLDGFVDGLGAKVAAIEPTLRVFAMGHLGDGNLHLTITSGQAAAHLYKPVAEAVYAGLGAAGGSFSAEHGIGLEKRASLPGQIGDTRLALMRAVKAALDPHGIMNPGKVL